MKKAVRREILELPHGLAPAVFFESGSARSPAFSSTNWSVMPLIETFSPCCKRQHHSACRAAP